MKSLEGREPLQAPWQDRGIQKKGGSPHAFAISRLLASKSHHHCLRSDDGRGYHSIFATIATRG